MNRFVRLSLALILGAFMLASAPPNAYARGVPEGFSELAEKLSPAVVNISTAQNIEIEDDVPAFEEGSPLERFNDFFGRRNNNGRVAKSLGSGFVIDADGYIVTNNHVIEGSDIIEAVFPNGDTYEAELLGRDPSTDIALLKIDAGKSMPFVNFGDSDAAEVGDWVMAIGNPFGYGGSVTAGIISARNRQINHGNYDDFIQTDVAINKGNSGGPLFDMDGDVIGVNTAILSPTGGSVGISFSVPSDLAGSVVKQLRQYGETRRGSLGIKVQGVDRNLADSYGLDKPKGAIVTRVIDGSPAEDGGMKIGDLILEVGGEPIENQRVLYRVIAEAEIGEPLELTILRKENKQKVTVIPERLKEKSTKPLSKTAKDDIDGASKRAVMGISIQDLSEDVRRKYKIKPEVQGVRVSKVASSSEASGKILSGDIIEQVAFVPVEDAAGFEKAVADAKDYDRPVTFLVNRGGNYIFYSLRVS